MSIRGLSISEESTFDFEPRDDWRQWPGARYGQESPHLQFAKGTKSSRAKHPSSPVKPNRPPKARQPKPAHPTKRKPAQQPSKVHGTIPAREPPLHLLTLPPELRNRLYELVAVHDGPHYPQLRPIWVTGSKRKGCDIRRFPLGPSLSLVNRQLREEVLSVFYGCNRFVFKASEKEMLLAYSMTSPATQKLWKAARPASHYLQHIELHINARRLPLDTTMMFKLKKLLDGGVEIAHDLADHNSYHCCCLEDEAIAETLVDARGESDLVRVLQILSAKRRSKLSAVGKEDGQDGMFRLSTNRCLHCRKPTITFVSGG